ncbi:hypothetical protein BLA9940_00827 [Burkholderia aenigmatica]|uniref:DUF427 domain-containing protein n=1 Tax=Burkholderia cepacia complex TaxID=87882 RepID=UPI000F090EA5|nr:MULTISPECIES: DUF427 domain-containing protein [Burkholderia cepacia complex]AYQ43006.1 hypothetical protein CVS37_35190 [Burkholderia lata]VWC42996.1 hypothetical protein BLA9940_00827 [Burkholderia aenigmatica]
MSIRPDTSSRPVKSPGPDHPITVEPHPQRVVVKVAGQVVADTRRALALREASYPAVLYIPREDADMTRLQRTEHATYCPYKGDAAYYSIPAGGERAVNAVWTYEAPYPAVDAIRGHLAFYPDRVDSIEESPAGSD